MDHRSPERNPHAPELSTSSELEAKPRPLARAMGETALQPEKLPEVSPLDAMRDWVRQSCQRPRLKIPPEYEAALEYLQQIQQTSAEANPETKLASTTLNRLIGLFARYQQATNQHNPQGFAPSFLEAFHEQFVKDVVYFRSEKVAEPERVAYYQSPSIMTRLNAAYANHEFISSPDVKKALSHYPRNPEEFLENLDHDVHSFSKSIEPTLRQEYGWEGKWSLFFLKEVRRNFKGDISVTACKILQTARALADKYPEAPHSTVERWAGLSVVNASKWEQTIRELLSEIPKIELTDKLQASGRETLERLRAMRLSGRQVFYRGENLIPYRLEQIAEANWRSSFAGFNLREHLGILHRTAQAFNERRGDNTGIQLDLSCENMYATFCAYADDLATFSAQMQQSPETYARAMHRYGPDIYARLTEAYQHESLPPNFLKNAIAKRYEDLEANIDAAIERMRGLQKYGPSLPRDFISSAINYPNIEAQVAVYVKLLPQAKAAFPWVSKSDVLKFSRRAKNSFSDFKKWAQKVETLRELQPHDRIFSLSICRALARSPEKVEDIIALHRQRVKELMTTYNHTQVISRGLAGMWAAKNSSPQTINAHLKRAEDMRKFLLEQGEEIDDISLGFLAGNNIKQRVQIYLEVKSQLTQHFQDDDNVEQWIIVHVAATSTRLNYAIKKVNIFRSFRRRGVFFTQLDPSDINNMAAHHRGAMQPEDILLQQEEQAERQAQIDTLLSGLNTHERTAVELCFGFISLDGEEKAALKEELGVDDLEAHVLETIIPRLQALK